MGVCRARQWLRCNRRVGCSVNVDEYSARPKVDRQRTRNRGNKAVRSHPALTELAEMFVLHFG